MPTAPGGPPDRQPVFDANSDLLSVVVRELAAGRECVVAEEFLPGITAVADFVAADDPTLEAVLDHVEHAVEVAGVEHVGFGFDFFEYLAPYRAGWGVEDPPFGGAAAGLDGDAAVAALPAALRERGFAAAEVARLCFENLPRVFDAVLRGG